MADTIAKLGVGPDRDTLAQFSALSQDAQGPWGDAEWLARQLNVQPAQASHRLHRLLTLGYLEQRTPLHPAYRITDAGLGAIR